MSLLFQRTLRIVRDEGTEAETSRDSRGNVVDRVAYLPLGTDVRVGDAISVVGGNHPARGHVTSIRVFDTGSRAVNHLEARLRPEA